MSVGNQARWTAKLIQRSIVGVVKGVPVEEDVNKIKWYCAKKGHTVGEVRRLGPTATVVSIEFLGPLPESISFPFSFRQWPTKVEPYTPGPKKCFKCFEYGHMTTQCVGPLRCAKCGGGIWLANVTIGHQSVLIVTDNMGRQQRNAQ